MQKLSSWGGLLIFITLLVAGLLSNFQGFVINKLSDKYKWEQVSPLVIVEILVILTVLLAFLSFLLPWLQAKFSNGNTQIVKSTTALKAPDDWRRELLEAMKIEVTKSLHDLLPEEEIIPLETENRQELVWSDY